MRRMVQSVSSQVCVVWNQLPKAVLVEFPGATFQLSGLAPGVYPITPLRRTWFLDAGRKHPSLAVTRKQLPLLPAFAMTAHQAQGQTLEAGVIADLNYKAISGAMTAYIAMTRVRNRKDLLILRAFEAELFQQGDQSFRKLLLQHWRSHDVDWDAIVQRYIQTRVCCECRTVPSRPGNGREQMAPSARNACKPTENVALRIGAADVRGGRLQKRFPGNRSTSMSGRRRVSCAKQNDNAVLANSGLSSQPTPRTAGTPNETVFVRVAASSCRSGRSGFVHAVDCIAG